MLKKTLSAEKTQTGLFGLKKFGGYGKYYEKLKCGPWVKSKKIDHSV